VDGCEPLIKSNGKEKKLLLHQFLIEHKKIKRKEKKLFSYNLQGMRRRMWE
jgi:hypothetical protein